ncbi:MAG: sigma-54 dependent transcriptional regulator [Actinomycetota bacterium]
MENFLQALVIDDEPQVRKLVADILRSDGWQVSEASSAKSALDLLQKQNWALIICDVMLGEDDGYSVLRQFTEQQSNARFVLMTGQGSAAGALDATAIGAYDYLVKPFKVDDILGLANDVRELFKIRAKHKKSKNSPKLQGYVSEIPLIGNSPKFVECLKMVGRVAATNLPVLITGESGTGKEVVAQAIHQRSSRAAKSFVAVNCGAIPVELIESELFGHTRGSFTGADRDRAGLWEEADGGTIFLDEITETSPLFQVKLLRALQQGEIRRVGSNRTQNINVRVIAATNRNIEEEVAEGRFRQDLMYRLNAVTIYLPPLRERLEDIPLLVQHFAKQVQSSDNSVPTFSSAALEMLEHYNWKGNVRELENAVLHAVSLSDDVIYPEHLPVRIRLFEKDSSRLPSDGGEAIPKANEQWLTLAEMEEKYIAQVLSSTDGNKQAAARLLNIDRKTLTRILKRRETTN